MKPDTIQDVITILSELINNAIITDEYLSDTIEKIEYLKNRLDLLDDDIIDKIDEIQDYLDYVIISGQFTDVSQIKNEVMPMIEELQDFIN